MSIVKSTILPVRHHRYLFGKFFSFEHMWIVYDESSIDFVTISSFDSVRFDFTTLKINYLSFFKNRPCQGGFSILNDTTSGRQTVSIVRMAVADTAVSIHRTRTIRVTNVRRTQPPVTSSIAQ